MNTNANKLLQTLKLSFRHYTDRYFYWIIFSVAFLGVLLHSAHLLHLLKLSNYDLTQCAWGADTPTYMRMIVAFSGETSLNPMYQERLLAPILMWLFKISTGNISCFLFLIVVLELPAAMSIGYIAKKLSAKSFAGIVASLIYIVYPDSYQYGVLLQTDTLHVELMLIALAFTGIYLERKKWHWIIPVIIMWSLCQLTRPTLFLLAGGFIFCMVINWRNKAIRYQFLVLGLGVMIVPMGHVITNYYRYGIPAPSLCQVEMLYTWTVPRVKTLSLNKKNPQPITALFERNVRDVRSTENWKNLHGQDDNREFKADPAAFKESYIQALNSSKKYITEHRSEMMETSWMALQQEFTTVPRYYHPIASQSLVGYYPDCSLFIQRAYKIFILFGMMGIIRSLTGKRNEFTFIMLVIILLIIIPSSLSWMCLGRYRYNVDIIIMPYAAWAMCMGLCWLVMAGVFLAGYLPHHIFKLPKLYFNSVVSVAMAIFVFFCVQPGVALSLWKRIVKRD